MTDSQLIEIQETISQIYTKNSSFFKEKHPHIFKKILDFEGKNKFSYSLDFVDNHFELLDEAKNKTYNCDPFYDSKHRVESLKNNKSAFSIIKLDKKYVSNHLNYPIEASKLINEYIESIDNKIITKSEKFIFLGTILGVHINDIDRELKSKVYLIIENNIEIFRLSMFLTDYKELSKNSTIYFSIANSKNEKETILKDFFNYLPELNNQIRFELACEKDIPLIDEVSSSLIKLNEFNYPFSEYLTSFTRGHKYFNKYKKLLQLNKLQNVFSNQRILFLGGGYSLKNNLAFIKNNKDKFLIVCVAATLKVLEENDIIPHIIISSDSSYLIEEQFNVNKIFYENSLIFLSNKTLENVTNIFPSKNIFFFNDSLELLNNTGVNVGVNVGNIGYSILLKLGTKEIYLLGFDACIDDKTGLSHSSHNKKTKLKKFDIKDDDKMSSQTYLIKYKGNFKEEVNINTHFEEMIKTFSEIEGQYNVYAYNLSEGALLPGIKPQKIESLKLEKKEDVSLIDISKKLLEVCKKSLTKKELIEIQSNKNLIDKLSKIDEKIYEEFTKIYNLNKHNTLLQIIDRYFQLINPYYNYLLQIDDKKANRLYKSHFKKICNYLSQNV